MRQDVTFVLCGYRRLRYLREQYEAVMSQTVTPVDVMFWRNCGGGQSIGSFRDVRNIKRSCTSAMCNKNLGVWARFAFALMAKTKYVCILDDDTIPGSRWVENCLETMRICRGPLGTRGLIFEPGGEYEIREELGVYGPQQETTKVDLITHNWFLERDWLSAFWRELPDPRFDRTGEDIHLCYTAQKFLSLACYVPPHPLEDRSLWGSHPEKAKEYSRNSMAVNRVGGHEKMNEYFKIALSKGFKLLH